MSDEKKHADQRGRKAKRGTIRVVDGKVVCQEEEIGAGSRTDGTMPINNYRTLHSRGRGDQAAK